MKRKPSKKDIIALTVNKIFDSVPEFETEEEFFAYLREDAQRPRADRIAEGRTLMEEAKKELENFTYLY